jgi:hypothetical protein
MSELLKRFAAGLASAQCGHRNFERALRKEWRAIRTAEQDRAHLATLVRPPFSLAGPVEPPIEQSLAPSPSVEPPARK